MWVRECVCILVVERILNQNFDELELEGYLESLQVVVLLLFLESLLSELKPILKAVMFLTPYLLVKKLAPKFGSVGLWWCGRD